MTGVATHAESLGRDGRVRGGQRGVTFLALLLGLPGGPEIVNAVAGGAVRRFDFGTRHNQRAVLACEELFLRAGMASAAEGGDFIRRGYPVRGNGSGGSAVLHAGAVAGVAAQAFFEMFVSLEIGNLLGVARRAEFVSFLGR